jgi:phage shock protein PspC (stress-responsive transcriptional regulator)
MKKNITINLCGRLFQIDEDAYELLQQYINSLRSSFGRQDGGEEIVDDIEARIAELFDELKANGTEAIAIEHVKDIISRIGKPEQLAGDDETDEKNGKKEGHRYDSFQNAAQDIFNNVRARTAGKRLYRNPKDKMVAGVLSGIAAYTNTDPVIWRFLTVVLCLFYGIGIIAYIVLAIVLPEAKNPEQQLQMEGKDVTPQNLADVVVDNDKPYVERPSLLRTLFSFFLKILLGFFVIIAMIVGVALCCGFLFALVVLVTALVFPVSSHLPFSLEAMGLAELYQSNPIVLIIFAISLFLLLLIPIYAIFHMVLSLTGKIQPMGVVQRIVWIVLWVVALCCIVPCSITMTDYHDQHYRNMHHEHENYSYQGVEMDEEDADYLRQGGWNLVKAENCAHYTYSGQYYDGNSHVRYLDAWNEACQEVYQVERKEAVEPGIYRLDCIARAEGPGPCVYAIGDQKMLKSIPVYGDTGGELVKLIQKEMADVQKNDTSETRSVSKTTVKIMGMEFIVNQSMETRSMEESDEGYGWSIVSIDNIKVSGDSIAYGVSTDAAFTGHPCRAQWLSATDFKLTRTGNLPKK